MNFLPLVAALCLVVCSMLNSPASAKQLGLLQPALPLTDESALICEAGDLLGTGAGGAGGQVQKAATNFLPSAGPHRQRFLIELVTRVDINRDQNLDHRELQSLDHRTRQQLLRQLDTNHDRKLSPQELERDFEQYLVRPEKKTTPSESLYPETPEDLQANAPPQPETFRNLRRFGIGIQQTSPAPRSQPFARAAKFGTTPGFGRVTKKSIGPRAGGSCRAPSDLYLRVSRPR